ncbi:MAG TPA: hypothetical protein VMG60_13270 [Burkholderiaceae bacterium]|nr:hypothetical protein [Burkholderiaceae bacterium]
MNRIVVRISSAVLAVVATFGILNGIATLAQLEASAIPQIAVLPPPTLSTEPSGSALETASIVRLVTPLAP